ncbi:hypothetical protein IAR55_004022 [Kwoniella newhampshirensis]|uniref:Methyltransferase n=1 Tax=Kwoniella newhampshirensis TaxID=1651941 RepID=A0AAW0YYB3_9TREE
MRPSLLPPLRLARCPRATTTQAYTISTCRLYATLSPHTPPPTAPYEVFDEPSKDRQRDRAILRLREQNSALTGEQEAQDPLRVVDYLREEISERLAERIEDLRVPPASILELSAHAGQLTQLLQEVLADEVPATGTSQSERRKWWIVESSKEALHRDDDASFVSPPKRIQASASNLLDHPEIEPLVGKVETIVNAGGLHWVGDIVGALTQVRHLLKEDGVFVGAVFGGDTLFELSQDPTDAPSLLTRAGFTLTTVDVEDIVIKYPSIWELMADLRDMGETNAILGRRAAVSRDVLLAAEAIYKDEDGSVPATFSIIFMIGWKPGPNQPKPLERGSAQTNLKDIL